ncbi:MAG: hypothetical protein WA125_06705 [Desulfosporosinus sp.]
MSIYRQVRNGSNIAVAVSNGIIKSKIQLENVDNHKNDTISIKYLVKKMVKFLLKPLIFPIIYLIKRYILSEIKHEIEDQNKILIEETKFFYEEISNKCDINFSIIMTKIADINKKNNSN